MNCLCKPFDGKEVVWGVVEVMPRNIRALAFHRLKLVDDSLLFKYLFPLLGYALRVC